MITISPRARSSGADSTLIVVDPAGTVHCNDDTHGLDLLAPGEVLDVAPGPAGLRPLRLARAHGAADTLAAALAFAAVLRGWRGEFLLARQMDIPVELLVDEYTGPRGCAPVSNAVETVLHRA